MMFTHQTVSCNEAEGKMGRNLYKSAVRRVADAMTLQTTAENNRRKDINISKTPPCISSHGNLALTRPLRKTKIRKTNLALN